MRLLLRHGKNYVQPSSVQFDGRNLGDVLGPHGPSRILLMFDIQFYGVIDFATGCVLFGLCLWSQLFYVDGFCPPFTGGRFHSDVVVAVATFSVATVQ